MAKRIQIEGIAVSPDHYINGQRISSPDTFEDRSPLNWSNQLARISRGNLDTANLAVEAANKAFPLWASKTASERAAYMNRLADIIDTNISTIAKIECIDMAMLEESLRKRVIPRAAENFRLYAELASTYEERQWTSKGTNNRVARMPAGPALVITPWNAPFMLSSWKCSPALAAGNTVILKPAEWSPLTASLLADFIEEANFPPGVFNIVQGIGEEIGALLTDNPSIRRISFTGSTDTAISIGTSAAKNIVPFTAELGGKSPLIVFDDADIISAANKAAGQYDDSGQVCMAGTRLLVDQKIKEPFLEAFHAQTDKHVLGDSRQSGTTISPVIHPDHLSRISGFIDRARSAGDKIIRGGKRWTNDGLWYEPTLIEPKSNSSEVVQNEIFGPVLTLQTFSSEAEAIRLANSTPYGLAAIVYTGSKDRAIRVANALRAGTIWTNCFLIRDLTAPFGGTGISGIGREGGDYALDFHSDLKTIQILEDSVQ